MSLTCSIIINTYNRAHYLRKLLPGLSHLQDVDFEVVIVNGPSTDDTEAVLAEYEGTIKTAVCPERNLSVSRNIGIAQAAGDIVVFIDDDALPADSQWLKRFVDAFEKNSAIGAAGGKVLQSDTENIEFNGGATTTYGFQRFDASDTIPTPADKKPWIPGVQGCNCAFRRSHLVDIGGYDEFFTYYLDETDVCIRMNERGYKTAYLADNPVRHYPARESSGQGKIGHKWHIITRSDTYFAMKNAQESLLKRAINTLRYARKKHFYEEFAVYRNNGSFTPRQYREVIFKWFTGVISGFWAGLTQKRKFRHFTEPPPFVKYPTTCPAKKLTIGLLSQSLPIHENYGGVARYTYDLAKGLHECGHEVHLFCKDETCIQRHGLDFIIHGISASEYANSVLFPDKPVLNKNTTYSTAIERRIQKLSKAGITFDVLQASNWDAEAVGVMKKGTVPVVLTLVTSLAQDIVEMKWNWNDDMKSCVALDYWQIMHADALCVPSEGVLESYKELMHLPNERLAQAQKVALGIDPDSSSYTRQDTRKNILFVGRCERRKGVDSLLAILPELLTEHPDWWCHLVGNDQILNERGITYKENFLTQYDGAPWLSRVVFHGFVDEAELKRFYRDCDIFVAPSSFESFGLIYLEAMQYAKPVIGCTVGGISETVGPDAGILVEPENVKQLHDAVHHLIHDEHLRKTMGRRGKERIEQHMNHQKMAKRYENLFYKCSSPRSS